MFCAVFSVFGVVVFVSAIFAAAAAAVACVVVIISPDVTSPLSIASDWDSVGGGVPTVLLLVTAPLLLSMAPLLPLTPLLLLTPPVPRARFVDLLADEVVVVSYGSRKANAFIILQIRIIK